MLKYKCVLLRHFQSYHNAILCINFALSFNSPCFHLHFCNCSFLFGRNHSHLLRDHRNHCCYHAPECMGIEYSKCDVQTCRLPDPQWVFYRDCFRHIQRGVHDCCYSIEYCMLRIGPIKAALAFSYVHMLLIKKLVFIIILNSQHYLSQEFQLLQRHILPLGVHLYKNFKYIHFLKHQVYLKVIANS